MMTRPLFVCLWLLMCLSPLAPLGAAAAEQDDRTAWTAATGERLKQLQSAYESWKSTPPTLQTFGEVQEEILTIREHAETCVTDLSAQFSGVEERIAALGPPDPEAPADIQATRKQFESEQQTIESQLAACKLLSLGARDLRDGIAQQRRLLLSRQLLHRENDVWRTFTDLLVNGFASKPLRHLDFDPWPALGAGLLLLMILLPTALMIAGRLRERFAVPRPDQVAAPTRGAMLARMYSRRSPWLALGLVAVVTLFIGKAAPLAAIATALLISSVLAPLIQLFICQGKLKCVEGMPARLLFDLVLVAGALMFFESQAYVPDNAFALLRALYFLTLAGVALWLLHRLTRRDDMRTLRSLRLPISIALLAGPTADWLGYHNLGELLVLGVYGTGAGMLLTWLLTSLVGHTFDTLGDTESEVQPAIRQRLGYARGERIPGLGMIHWVIQIAVLVGLAYWLLFAWQVSESSTATVRDVVQNGFSIGAVRIVPSKLIGALLAFLVLLALARWLRRQLGEHWLTKTALDSGARQSIVSLTSYTIVGAAIMLALSMAGLNLQNLAIVAGALSVGIGFGLQNIVNNFVSGLILLFERPVRPGDWVVVGNTEGHVRRISIRYTLIQTFDRADVLVPNSELISNQVTNLMLSDSFGRVNVPVGVAYGTDTRLVRDILHKIAREHPMALLHDAQVSPPRVLFMGFGESSLDFELRFFIQNIDYRLSVRSDVLFAIDDAFREAGIEIPFPQRVVHMQQQAEPPAGHGRANEPNP